MALFTLDRAYASGNTLKYEQLNSDETYSANSSLPTDSASQSSMSETRRGLEGAASQAATFTPLRVTPSAQKFPVPNRPWSTHSPLPAMRWPQPVRSSNE